MPKFKEIASNADILAVYNHFATTAIALFNAEGRVAPQMFAVVLEEGGVGKIHSVGIIPPEEMHALMRNSASKEGVRPLLDLLLSENSPMRRSLKAKGEPAPCIVVQITEAWIGEGPPVAGEERLAPSKRSDRKEIVSVCMHTQTATHMGMSYISDAPMRHCVLGALRFSEAYELMGRMTRTPLPSEDSTITKH